MKRHHEWYLLSAHGLVLIHFSRQPESTIAETATALGLHARHVSRIIGDLRGAELLTVIPDGRRRKYLVNLDASVRHPAVQGHKLREVLPLFGHGQGEAEARPKSASADLKQAGRAKPVALLVMAPGTLADSLQRSIEQIGFGIRRADSEEAAFRELTSQDIDVVVVDGRLNGDDLARRLKREGLPVFVLTPDGAQTAAGEPQVPFHLWALRTADHSQA